MRRIALVCAALSLALSACAGRHASPTAERAAATTGGHADAARTDAPATTPAAPRSDAPQRAAARGPLPVPALPRPAPADTSDYRVAARDQLTVQVYGQDDLSRTVRVSERGTITLPLIGEVHVAGLEVQEIERTIEAALKPNYLKDPRVSVAVSEFQGRQFAVVGAVNQPGAYPFRTNQVSLLQALSEARGVRENADSVAYVLRARAWSENAEPIAVDLDSLLRTGRGDSILLEPGDYVYVPEANTFFVTGEVEKRGAYTLRRDTTLSKALVEAGGVTNRAAHGNITVIRTDGKGERREITGLDLDAIMRGDPEQDLPLRAQDVVVVPRSGAKAVGYGMLDFVRGLFSVGIPIIP